MNVLVSKPEEKRSLGGPTWKHRLKLDLRKERLN
jgi:hypothetical protein